MYIFILLANSMSNIISYFSFHILIERSRNIMNRIKDEKMEDVR